MNVNEACHSQPAFKQGGTIAEHPVHRPRMPLPCADRTRRCLFFFPPSIIIPLSLSQEMMLSSGTPAFHLSAQA